MFQVVVQDTTDVDTMHGLCQWMEGYKHIKDNIFEVVSKNLLPNSARITSSRVVNFQLLASSICQCLGSDWRQIYNAGSTAILEHCHGYSLILGISNSNSERWTLHLQINCRLSTDTNKDTNSRGWISLPELAEYDLHRTFIFSRQRKVESITKFIKNKILPNYICCYQASVIKHKEKMARFGKLVMEGNKLASIVDANVSIRKKADVSFIKQNDKTNNKAVALLNLQREGKATGQLTFENLSIEQMQVLLETYKQITQ